MTQETPRDRTTVDRRTALASGAVGGLALLAASLGGRGGPQPDAGAVSPTASLVAASAGTVTGRVMIIRHAEKPVGSTKGVMPTGLPDKKSLIVQGWTRAGAIARLFAPTGSQPPSALAVPTALYAADPKSDASKRPAQTVSVLAAHLGLTVSTDYSPTTKDFPKLVAAATASAATGAVLIAWQHEDIPTITSLFGAVTPTPPTSWPSDRFDLVWVLDRTTSGWAFSQVPQLLLAGDSAAPIT